MNDGCSLLLLLTQRTARTESRAGLLYLPRGNHSHIPPRPLRIHSHILWAQTAERDRRIQWDTFEFITENPHTNLATDTAMSPVVVWFLYDLLWFYISFYLCVCVEWRKCMHTSTWVATEFNKELWVPWSWSYKRVVSCVASSRDPDSRPLKEQHALLPAAPSFEPPDLFLWHLIYCVCVGNTIRLLVTLLKTC